MTTIKNIYNGMNARTLYIVCATALAGCLTACSNDDDTTTPTDGANTPISATASVAQAWGSVSRGFTSESGLSELTLWYVAADATDTYTKFNVPDGTDKFKIGESNYDYITKPTDTSFGFNTGLDTDEKNSIAPHLFWQAVNADKPFFLTATKTNGVFTEKLWAKATADGYRDTLDFGKMYNRNSKLTLEVKAAEGSINLDARYLKAYMKLYQVYTSDNTKLAYNADITNLPQLRVLIEKAATETEEGSSIRSTQIYIPQALTDATKTLTIWYDANNDDVEDAIELYTIDLSKVTVTRPSESVYDPATKGAWPYNTASPNTSEPDENGFQRFNEKATTFAFNANEHIALTVTLSIATTLTPGKVTVTAFTDGTEYEFDGEYTNN